MDVLLMVSRITLTVVAVLTGIMAGVLWNVTAKDMKDEMPHTLGLYYLFTIMMCVLGVCGIWLK